MTGKVLRFAGSRTPSVSHHPRATLETKDVSHDSPSRGAKAKATRDSIDLHTLLVRDLNVRKLPTNLAELKRSVVESRTFASGRVMLRKGSPLPRQTLQYLVDVKEYAAAFKLLRMVAPSERVAPLLQLLDIRLDRHDTEGKQARQECLKATAMWLWRHEHNDELDALLAKCSPRQSDWLRACMFRKELVSSQEFWALPE